MLVAAMRVLIQRGILHKGWSGFFGFFFFVYYGHD